MKRRTFLHGATAVAISPWLSACSKAPETGAGQSLERIGIQLYTVRNQMAEDVPGTLQAIAEIGYDEVEFAGYFEHTPEAVKGFLDAAGLVSPSVHIRLEDIRNAPMQLIETA